MLHFLLGLALCIFIGERLWHYISAWRLHRAVRRSLQWPPPEPSQFTERGAFALMVVLATTVFVIMIAAILRVATMA